EIERVQSRAPEEAIDAQLRLIGGGLGCSRGTERMEKRTAPAGARGDIVPAGSAGDQKQGADSNHKNTHRTVPMSRVIAAMVQSRRTAEAALPPARSGLYCRSLSYATPRICGAIAPAPSLRPSDNRLPVSQKARAGLCGRSPPAAPCRRSPWQVPLPQAVRQRLARRPVQHSPS